MLFDHFAHHHFANSDRPIVEPVGRRGDADGIGKMMVGKMMGGERVARMREPESSSSQLRIRPIPFDGIRAFFFESDNHLASRVLWRSRLLNTIVSWRK
jgi:hypothetical protein